MAGEGGEKQEGTDSGGNASRWKMHQLSSAGL